MWPSRAVNTSNSGSGGPGFKPRPSRRFLRQGTYPTLSLFSQVCNWVPVTYCWGVTLQWTSVSQGGNSETPRHASCYGNWYKLRPFGPLARGRLNRKNYPFRKPFTLNYVVYKICIPFYSKKDKALKKSTKLRIKCFRPSTAIKSFCSLGSFYRPKWQTFLPFNIPQLGKSLPFHIPKVWKRYPFRAEHPHMDYNYRGYSSGPLFLTRSNSPRFNRNG